MPAPNTYPEPVVNTNLTLSTNYSSVAVPVEDLNYTIEADYGTGSSQNSVKFNPGKSFQGVISQTTPQPKWAQDPPVYPPTEVVP
jgi:hypothetical protein